MIYKLRYSLLLLLSLSFIVLTACSSHKASISEVKNYPTSLIEHINNDEPIKLFYENNETAFLLYSSNQPIKAFVSIQDLALTIHLQTDSNTSSIINNHQVFKLSIPTSPEYLYINIDGTPTHFNLISNQL